MEEDFSQQDYTIPQVLQRGTPVMKVSSKKHKSIILRLDPDLGQVIWESKQNHISMFFGFIILPHQNY